MAINLPNDNSLPPSYPPAIQKIIDEIQRTLNKHGKRIDQAINEARRAGFPDVGTDVGIFFKSPYFNPTILERRERAQTLNKITEFRVSAEDNSFLKKLGISLE